MAERGPAQARVWEMCQKLIADRFIEDLRFELEELAPARVEAGYLAWGRALVEA